MKKDTIYQAELIDFVMADLRKYGAKCSLRTDVATEEIVIRASFLDGKLWEVIEIEDNWIRKRYEEVS